MFDKLFISRKQAKQSQHHLRQYWFANSSWNWNRSSNVFRFRL